MAVRSREHFERVYQRLSGPDLDRAAAELSRLNLEAVAGFCREDIRGVTERVILAYFGDLPKLDPCTCATYGFHEPALPGQPDPACPEHGESSR